MQLSPKLRNRSLERVRDHLLLVALWGLPTTILLSSYAYLAFEHNALNLFNVVVHESGSYTLLETILYTRHFIREVPICIMTATAVAGAFLWYAPLASLTRIEQERVWRLCKISYLGALVIFALSALSSAWKQSVKDLLLDLLQFQTRDEVVSFGSHWQYHLLHLAFIFLASLGVAKLLRIFSRHRSVIPRHMGRLLITVSLLSFIVLTLILGLNLRPFQDPLYLGHQFREIVTHGSLTLSLSFGLLFTLELRLFRLECAEMPSQITVKDGLLILSAILIPFFILFQLRNIDIMSYTQKESSYLDLFASHNFEHTIDYIFVMLLTMAFYLHIQVINRGSVSKAKGDSL